MKRIGIPAIVFLLAWGSAQASNQHKLGTLKAQEHRQILGIERAKNTLAFFQKHPKLLYSANARVKRRAWHAVAVMRQRIIYGRRALARTRAALERLRQPAIAHRGQWLCIYSHENGGYGWRANTGNGYYGGLQMDRGFMGTYGKDMLTRHGGAFANRWTPTEQMIVAERAWRDRGFYPWPSTARACGLL